MWNEPGSSSSGPVLTFHHPCRGHPFGKYLNPKRTWIGVCRGIQLAVEGRLRPRSVGIFPLEANGNSNIQYCRNNDSALAVGTLQP
jgi:hypothetical protein